MQHDEVTTLLLNIGTVQSSTDIHVYLFLVQTQLRYIFLLLSHHHSPTSSDLAIMITPYSAHTLEQMHLGTRLHSSHPPAEICSECLLDLDEQLCIANSNRCGFKGTWYHWYLSVVAVSKPRYDLIRKQNLVQKIYPRCSVIGENVISGACGVYWAHEPINVISVNFKDIHF